VEDAMTTKIIQVPMNEELLKKLNKFSKKQKVKRAALVRQACERLLKQLQEEEWDRQYVEGYRRIPEDPAIGEVGLKLAAEILAKEDW
jgi:metal-responsive CopG/Arc/MetJ family transcriptional regulator